MLEEVELFPYLPPLTPPRKSISKGFSASFKSGPVVTKIQTFSKWNVLRQIIVKLSFWRRKETENICAYSPPHPISLQQLSDFFVENLQDFNGGVQFSWKAPSVWKRFPWKAIQIFRARMRVSLLLCFKTKYRDGDTFYIYCKVRGSFWGEKAISALFNLDFVFFWAHEQSPDSVWTDRKQILILGSVEFLFPSMFW